MQAYERSPGHPDGDDLGAGSARARALAHVRAYTHPVGRGLVGMITYNNTVSAMLGVAARDPAPHEGDRRVLATAARTRRGRHGS